MLTAITFSAALVAPAALHRYGVNVDERLMRMEVRACFADGLPDRLIADHPLAARATSEFRYQLNERQVVTRPQSGVMTFRQPSDDDCIEWSVDLDEIAAVNRMNIGYRAGDSLLLAPGTWFWRPPVLTANRDIEFDVQLPADMQMSVPWQALGDGRYRYVHSPLGWPGLMAIGKLETRAMPVAGGNLHLAITDGPARVDAALVHAWLQAAALAVGELWGAFPLVESVQLLVVPVHDGRDAAPWAQANRGGGPAVHLFMNARADEQTLRDDWIATHELAHLALPFVYRSDAWLPEGFASYYQYVLRARAGQMPAVDAWQALHDGFMRGNRDTANNATLQEDSRQMHNRGRTMRVYWTGAAIAFQADVELRRRSGGEWSLDRVLQEFNACCRKPEKAWRARELFAKFDEISGTDIFDSLYRAQVHSRHFPRLDGAWQALGITFRKDRIEFGETHVLRDAIMAPTRQTDINR